jgi:hypothetical protein
LLEKLELRVSLTSADEFDITPDLIISLGSSDFTKSPVTSIISEFCPYQVTILLVPAT